MNNTPLLSIIIPVYNCQDYLDRCIQSVLNQTFQDYELILINDGSKDSSLDICDKYKDLDPRIIVINQKNKGQGNARNSGLKIAKGSYIGFIDSDDWIEKEMYSIMLENLQKYSLDLIECSYVFANDNTILYCKNDEKCKIYHNDDILKEHLKETNFDCVIWDKVYKKEVIDCFFEEDKYLEDIFWLFKVLSNCNKAGHINIPFYAYYQRSESLSGVTYNIKKTEAIECAIARILYFESKELYTILPLAEAKKNNECLYHYQQIVASKLDKDNSKKKDIIKKLKNNKYNWKKELSFKQRMWIYLFSIFPTLTVKIRILLKIGL